MTTIQINQDMADTMVEKALDYCAQKKMGGDAQEAAQALQRGRCDLCALVAENLVSQVGEYLGILDKTVRAVYRYEPEYTTLRPGPGKSRTAIQKGGINLVAWVERKSPALASLGATLETVLNQSRRKFQCKNATSACYVLDLQMVDDKDLQEHRSHGLVVNSMFIRSFPVWERTEPGRMALRIQDENGRDIHELLASFDPEHTPEKVLFEQALAIENVPKIEREGLEHQLREIRVALIRRLISDQLSYINIAKSWFTTEDLLDVFKRRIGYGRVGGKAAGMLLAARILREVASDQIRNSIQIPDSYFLGSDLIYLFMAMNGLMHWNKQKYKSEEEIREEYPLIRDQFESGKLPPEVVKELKHLLEQIGPVPIIVRSSSLLEDNFGTSFAGKYDSHFCPNQGNSEENLKALTRAISLTYASTLKPEALLYRRSKGLQDYDERMAILIQVVQGERTGKYFLPFGAGVAFSRNIFRWSPLIRREDGFARLVWGLGTRAVERVGNDYPRIVALSHPALLPDDTAEAIRYYSQQYVDVINMEKNTFVTLPVHQVLRSDYGPLRFLAQLYEDDYLSTLRSRVIEGDIHKLTVTFDSMLRMTPFAKVLSGILKTLEEHYHTAIDLEFTVSIHEPNAVRPEIKISLLQCRPQSRLKSTGTSFLTKDISHENIVFSTSYMVPQGYLTGIRYVLLVHPEEYAALPTLTLRNEVRKVVAQVNAKLPEKSYLCIGPGRWGTTNPDLGVFVSYADINNAGALVELSGKGIGPAPEPSLGTHFFQDLMEAQIYPLAIPLDARETLFNQEFFYSTPNQLEKWVQCPAGLVKTIRLIEVGSYRSDHLIEVVMDDDIGQAVAYLKKE
jgi:hypothetical protein